MRALGRELIRKNELEDCLMAIKIERDFEKYTNSKYDAIKNSGSNLQ